ncbi:hypothetical protein GCM10027026_07190 [Myroides odoratimimus subsp. xuanwuensis]
MFDFLVARAHEDERAAYESDAVDHYLLDGARVTLAAVERARHAPVGRVAERRLLGLRARAALYADHPDYRAEWGSPVRGCGRGSA